MSKRVTAFACAFMAGSLFAQSVIPNNPGKKPTVAIRNATIYPVTSAPILRTRWFAVSERNRFPSPSTARP